jgi:hypothetical protein
MQPVEPRTRVEEPPLPQRSTWQHKLGTILFIIVCFEVGVFLIIFPWTQQWETNALANLYPWLRDFWTNSYFRGALSGLGVLNIYISLGELARLRRPRMTPPADRLKVLTL